MSFRALEDHSYSLPPVGTRIVRWTQRPQIYVYLRDADTGQRLADSAVQRVRAVIGELSGPTGAFISPSNIVLRDVRWQDDSATLPMETSEEFRWRAGAITISHESDLGGQTVGYTAVDVHLDGTIGWAAIRLGGEDRDRAATLRHELGHALGFEHPFEHAPGGDLGLIEDSVMNYLSTGKGATSWTQFDREALRVVFSRPPLNADPDTDPAPVETAQAVGARTVIFDCHLP